MDSGRDQLRRWLERAHLTQREAARLLGMHFTSLSQILGQRERSPSLARAVRIERVTGIPVEAWMPTAVDAERTSQPATPVTPRLAKRKRHAA